MARAVLRRDLYFSGALDLLQQSLHFAEFEPQGVGDLLVLLTGHGPVYDLDRLQARLVYVAIRR